MPESNTPINNQPDYHDAPDSENDSDDEDGLLDVDINVMHDSEVDSERIVASVRNILSEHEIDKGAISIAIVGDDKIQELNKHYLQHDYETDVLSFVLDDDPNAKLLNGEIIVSADTAMRVSAEIGVKYSDELLLYVVHGCLHLVGYGDKSESERLTMRTAEQKFMLLAGAEYHQSTEDQS